MWVVLHGKKDKSVFRIICASCLMMRKPTRLFTCFLTSQEWAEIQGGAVGRTIHWLGYSLGVGKIFKVVIVVITTSSTIL